MGTRLAPCTLALSLLPFMHCSMTVIVLAGAGQTDRQERRGECVRVRAGRKRRPAQRPPPHQPRVLLLRGTERACERERERKEGGGSGAGLLEVVLEAAGDGLEVAHAACRKGTRTDTSKRGAQEGGREQEGGQGTRGRRERNTASTTREKDRASRRSLEEEILRMRCSRGVEEETSASGGSPLGLCAPREAADLGGGVSARRAGLLLDVEGALPAADADRVPGRREENAEDRHRDGAVSSPQDRTGEKAHSPLVLPATERLGSLGHCIPMLVRVSPARKRTKG